MRYQGRALRAPFLPRSKVDNVPDAAVASWCAFFTSMITNRLMVELLFDRYQQVCDMYNGLKASHDVIGFDCKTNQRRNE